jgi:tRNA(Ile)-lysidine synthase
VGPACVAVAYSGGRDSSALLHATLAVAAPLGVRVAALHVHHGLSPHADDWLVHCEAQCARWAKRGWPVGFASFRASDCPAAGDSVEAWARTLRYRALRDLALQQGASVVLLAHHRRDQAETFLLQALRGAGPAGLAGMPASVVREGVTWARPWLHRPREDIEAYGIRHRLKCIEDGSNDDSRYARNRLRLQAWPALVSSFPQAESALADSARWAQQALECLSDLAIQDLGPLTSGSDGLDVNAWLELSVARRSNVLRAWLKFRSGRSAPASLVARLMAELQPRGNARWPWESGELRAYRGVLHHASPDGQRPQSGAASAEGSLSVNRVGQFRLPGWGGCLLVKRTKEHGVPLAWLGRLELKPRSGAERFQLGPGRPPRSLKKQYQANAVPAWERQGPLLYSGGQLVFVPGLGLDARVWALAGQEQVSLSWLSSARPATSAAEVDVPGS